MNNFLLSLILLSSLNLFCADEIRELRLDDRSLNIPVSVLNKFDYLKFRYAPEFQFMAGQYLLSNREQIIKFDALQRLMLVAQGLQDIKSFGLHDLIDLLVVADYLQINDLEIKNALITQIKAKANLRQLIFDGIVQKDLGLLPAIALNVSIRIESYVDASGQVIGYLNYSFNDLDLYQQLLIQAILNESKALQRSLGNLSPSSASCVDLTPELVALLPADVIAVLQQNNYLSADSDEDYFKSDDEEVLRSDNPCSNCVIS